MRSIALTLLGGALLGCAPHPVVDEADAEPEVQIVVAPPPDPDLEETRWTPLRIAEDCIVRIADNPESLEARLRWEPCADGTPGCREMSDPAARSASTELRSLEGVAKDGEVVIAMSISLGGVARRYTIGPLEGPPFVAVEGPVREKCSLGDIGLGDDGAVIEIGHRGAHDTTTRTYLRGPLHADPKWGRVAAVLSRGDTWTLVDAQVRSIGGHVVVAAPGEPLLWAGDLGWHLVPRSNEGRARGVQSRDAEVLFTLDRIPHRVMGARLGLPMRVLRAARSWEHGIDGFAVSGSHAAWLEGHGRTLPKRAFETVELWTAEVSDGPTLSRERRLATLPRTRLAETRIGGDVIAVPLGDRGSALAVLSLTDGRVRVLHPPRHREIERIAWLGRDEIAVALRPVGRLASAEPIAIRRLAVATLPLLDPPHARAPRPRRSRAVTRP